MNLMDIGTKGIGVFPIEVSLDNLVLLIKNVTQEEYETFILRIESNRIHYPNTPIKKGMSSRAGSYRHNMNFGFGEGGIRVDYRQNMLAPTVKKCDLRLEFNPSKTDKLNHTITHASGRTEQYKPADQFFKIIIATFNNMGQKSITGWTGHKRVIREIDVACDYAVHKDKIVVMNLTGKEPSLVKGTKYWGKKHSHGYLKVYDKKKEREDKKDRKYDKYEHVTRIEYTMRFEEDAGINELSRIKDFEVDTQYKIHVICPEEIETLDPTVKAYVLCYMNGLMQLSEFSRRYREKTKTALQEVSEINLNLVLKKQFKEKVISTITKYIRN